MTLAGEAPPARRRGSVLLAAALGSALNPLNSTMIAVALPALSAEFGATPSSVTLTVVTGYLVATLVSQMPAGSIADRIGYGRALSTGRWLFCAGAVAATVAPRLEIVVLGRWLMAAGGSLIIPTAMALVRVTVPEDRRARAFGLLGAVLGTAAAIGPAIGAWLIAHFHWRVLFIANVPILAASWLAQPPLGELRRADRVPRPFDWIGSLLIGTALVLLTFSTRSRPPAAFLVAGGGIAAVAALVAWERRATAPVLHLSLFGLRGFVTGAGVIAAQNFAMYSLLTLVPFVFAAQVGGAGRLGIALTAMTATMAAASPLGGWCVEWVGARVVVIAGGIVGAAGVSLLTQLEPSSSLARVVVALLLVGLGIGLSTGPAQSVALASVAPDQSGVASATVSMLRYLGAIAGTALLGATLVPGAAHVDLALRIFAAAFVASAALGAAFPRGRRAALSV